MIKSFSRATFACSFVVSLVFVTAFAPTFASSLFAQDEIESANSLPAVADESDLFENGSLPLPRGPVHEAFAEPVQLTPRATLVVKEKPPVAITETPANRPAGEDVQWIDGYWRWNESVEQYLWVSGVWRKTPPGRRWEPGRWSQVDNGHQWVPGSWLPQDTETAEVSGFLNVPASVEAGPNQPEPENSFWVPGNWKPIETPAKEAPPGVSDGYSWRPGSWSPAHDEWVWIPEHYSWTPDGCRMVAGYWDYPWSVRGTMHACCAHPTENYAPVALNTEDRFTKLWTNPKTGEYHYGDYHGEKNPGYVPWHQYHAQNMGYDPLYCHYSRIVGPRVGGDFCDYLDSRYAYNQSGGSGRQRGTVGGVVVRRAVPIGAAAAASTVVSGGAASAAATAGGSSAAQVLNAAAGQPVGAASELAGAASEAANPIANPLDNIGGEGEGDSEDAGVADASGGGASAGGASAGASNAGGGAAALGGALGGSDQ